MPYWNFEKIMDIEKKFDVRSTFFFLNETKKIDLFKPSTYKLTLGHYNIDDPRIVRIIRRLDSYGWEIGVHGSYDSYLSKELLLREKKALENVLHKPVLGIRQHYLNLDIPRTWELQKEAGFKYDASFGLRDSIGLRDRIGMPFQPLGDGFIEIPLAIMDGPLFELSKDGRYAWQKCKKLIDLAEERGELLTVLWHNNRFNEKEYPGGTEIYEKIIKEGLERDAWFATCNEIYRKMAYAR
jgi:peptidoglycan/xylan/chitin deacetylase (PgdA/CDA1 family)